MSFLGPVRNDQMGEEAEGSLAGRTGLGDLSLGCAR